MKTLAITIATLFIALLSTSFILQPESNPFPDKDQPAAITMIPDSIQKIIQKACLDCHSDQGNSMARSKLNFANWDSFSPEKQAKKAAAICNVLKKGNMPPKKFKAEYPEVVPTKEQVDAICKWAISIQK